ncbi:putative coiled-coil domain-containing protein 195 [Neopsephotus bourkii]|uniref:putative coiled-coil domain-containing protein 195 n=1 Tax=Neopsephotus bourkii TaxID=309878 RepID=UPI002AA55F48|nr:putative coiled-coil domain-containing protein 195 [Neopsephotus bourkii]
MEGNAHLLQVICKMRSQINKLERENRALRGELRVCGQRAVPLEREAAGGGGSSNVRSLTDDDGEGPGGSPASLHGSVVAGPAPAPKEQRGTEKPGLSTAHTCAACAVCPSPAVTCLQGMGHNTTMTVRRYFTAPPAPAPASTRSHWVCKTPPSSGLSSVPPAPPAAAQLSRGEEKGLEKTAANCLSCSHSSKMNLCQEHVYKCRGKIKAVTFLLPMDMSSYAKKQDSLKSPQNQSTKQLTPIAEKDM